MLVIGILARVSNSEISAMHRDTSTTYSYRLGRGSLFLLAAHLLACRALPADVGHIVLVISSKPLFPLAKW